MGFMDYLAGNNYSSGLNGLSGMVSADYKVKMKRLSVAIFGKNLYGKAHHRLVPARHPAMHKMRQNYR